VRSAGFIGFNGLIGSIGCILFSNILALLIAHFSTYGFHRPNKRIKPTEPPGLAG
jgi:hypothetical protein